jgi:4-hydroxy-tetrahydrodipicolinate synthase
MLGLAVAGEYNTLNFDEKIQFVITVTRANNSRIPFICSVTAADFNESIELTKIAKSFGADGICVQLPQDLTFSKKLLFLEQLENLSPSILMIQDLDWSGDGMALEEIVKLFHSVEKFNWLKIETVRAGEKYTSVLQELEGRLKVCGGWAVTQLIDAMARSVNAFIPTGLEKIYVEIYHLYQNGNKEEAQLLFEKVLPVLNFSNQNIGTSIRFFKDLRVLEGLFESNYCRDESAVFDKLQEIEAVKATSIANGLLARYS